MGPIDRSNGGLSGPVASQRAGRAAWRRSSLFWDFGRNHGGGQEVFERNGESWMSMEDGHALT